MGWGTPSPTTGPADIYREHARLSAYQNDGRRLFDLGRDVAHRQSRPMTRWSRSRWGGTPFADGRFPTPDGKARLVAVAQAPLAAPLADWPMTLNTGRYRDQWHTMTRTGLSPTLSRHRQEPLVEIHPLDAAAHGIERRRSGAGRRRRRAPACFASQLAPGPAPRRDLRADPLDRPPVERRPHRPARPPARRSASPASRASSRRRRASSRLPVEWRGFLVARTPAGADRRRLCHPRSRAAGLAGRASGPWRPCGAWPRSLLPKGERGRGRRCRAGPVAGRDARQGPARGGALRLPQRQPARSATG